MANEPELSISGGSLIVSMGDHGVRDVDRDPGWLSCIAFASRGRFHRLPVVKEAIEVIE
jgi:hypothetical protein